MTTATQRILLVVLLVLGARARAVGQELRVTVLDSASRRPLASAVLTWFDAAGSPLGRNITNERGQQSVALSPVARRLRVLRLGYRVRDVALPPAYGPDADVLLDEGFSNGYCFRVADSEGARPNQVGLGFSAADRRKGRVDIEGALWIDTVAHVLKDIDFRFVAFRRVYGEVEPGGRVSFREMPNGMVLIDRWMLRLSASRADTTYARGMEIRTWFYAREIGGEVARAIWPDGRAWKASLGTVQLHVVTADGKPATSVIVRLTDTDYLGTPDARGDLEIADVLPGPYDVGIIDTALAPAGITLGTPLKLYAQRDSIVRAPLVEPPPEAFLRAKCARTEVHHWVTARVRRPDDTLVAGAAWELGENMGTGDEYVYGSGRTNTNGELGFCSALSSSRVLQVRVSDGLQPPRHVIVSILGDVTNILIELPARPR